MKPMPAIRKADHIKLQLLDIEIWQTDNLQPRWVAIYRAPGGRAGDWVCYKDGKARHPYNPISKDNRIMARTEAGLIRLILEDL